MQRIGSGGEIWLRTKPFSAPPGYELVECFRTFAHIVDRLGLGFRAQVLDVGCGPGWLSEFLARCGYWVTGVDVSEDMAKIARERIAAIQEPVAPGLNVLAEIHAMPVLEMPWRERFDAAILYDTMHHFHNEVETLRVIRRTLVPGGRLFIHEGVRPAAGSVGEQELIAEMEVYGTLESPFDAEYLEDAVLKAGFGQVKRLAAVDELLDVSDRSSGLDRLEAQLSHPPMNTVIAVNPAPVHVSEDQPEFLARLEPAGAWEKTADGQEVALAVTVTNLGRGYWPTAMGRPTSFGTITIGTYLVPDRGERVEFPRVPLPRSVAPGESADCEVRVPLAVLEGGKEVGIDLVREEIAWFADYGSSPLVVALPSDA